MTALDLALDGLAAYRLTKLIADDDITAGPRDRVVRAAYETQGRRQHVADQLADAYGGPIPDGAWSDHAQGDPFAPKPATLVTCRWCTGMWVAAAVVLARRAAPRTWSTLARLLSLSAAAALLAGLEDG